MEKLLQQLGLLKIGQYRYVKALRGGKAAAAAIYKNEKDEKVVFKFLILPRYEEELDRFRREAECLINLRKYAYRKYMVIGLSKVNKVPRYPVYFYKMEFVEGISLSQIFKKTPPPLEVKTAAEYLHRIGTALSPCNAAGVVHGDLHLGNILIADQYREKDDHSLLVVDPGIRILDFGCAKYWGPLKYRYVESYKEKMRHIASIYCWSPEYIKNPSSIGLKHDIWALGNIFYYMLTGKFAFESDTFEEYYQKITAKKFNKNSLAEINASPVIFHLVNRMFVVDPKSRISLGNITKICYDILNYNIKLMPGDTVSELYFMYDGNVWVCPRCKDLVFVDGNMCSKCGHREVDGFLPFYFYHQFR